MLWRRLAITLALPKSVSCNGASLSMNRTRNSLEMNEAIEIGSWFVSSSKRNRKLLTSRFPKRLPFLIQPQPRLNFPCQLSRAG
jgi:hypothetical protein